jgi:hypothetical protein
MKSSTNANTMDVNSLSNKDIGFNTSLPDKEEVETANIFGRNSGEVTNENTDEDKDKSSGSNEEDKEETDSDKEDLSEEFAFGFAFL